MIASENGQPYRKCRASVLVKSRDVYRGNDPLPVGRRAVALLSALAKRQGLVVSKDDLIQAAWSGLVVEESNLSVQIAALRKALAAEPGGESWIETLPRRGYRFIGPTTTSSHRGAIDKERMPPAQGVGIAIPSPGAAGGRFRADRLVQRPVAEHRARPGSTPGRTE